MISAFLFFVDCLPHSAIVPVLFSSLNLFSPSVGGWGVIKTGWHATKTGSLGADLGRVAPQKYVCCGHLDK